MHHYLHKCLCLSRHRFVFENLKFLNICNFFPSQLWPQPTYHLLKVAWACNLPQPPHQQHITYWASWADTLPTLARQLQAFTARVQEFFSNPAQAPPSIQAAHQAAGTLSANGWNPPTWHDLTNGTSPPRLAVFPNEGPTARGWQHRAANVIQTRCRAQLFTVLDPASPAMLTSQAGPHSSRAFRTIPFGLDFHYPSHLFRFLLLRRLRLPLQLAARTCRCRRARDLLSDHRAACAQSGVLGSRGGVGTGSCQGMPGSGGQGHHSHIAL